MLSPFLHSLLSLYHGTHTALGTPCTVMRKRVSLSRLPGPISACVSRSLSLPQSAKLKDERTSPMAPSSGCFRSSMTSDLTFSMEHASVSVASSIFLSHRFLAPAGEWQVQCSWLSYGLSFSHASPCPCISMAPWESGIPKDSPVAPSYVSLQTPCPQARKPHCVLPRGSGVLAEIPAYLGNPGIQIPPEKNNLEPPQSLLQRLAEATESCYKSHLTLSQGDRRRFQVSAFFDISETPGLLQSAWAGNYWSK